MSRRPREVCAVCGQGGYWVGWSGEHGELRCANHVTEPGPAVALHLLRPYAECHDCGWTSGDADKREAAELANEHRCRRE